MRKRRYRFYGSRVECCRRSTRGAAATWSGVGERKVKEVMPDVERVMVVEGKGFSGEAVWRRKDGVWRCVKASAEIKWMTRVRHPGLVREWLERKGMRWEWR
jgi:hypothetical protein